MEQYGAQKARGYANEEAMSTFLAWILCRAQDMPLDPAACLAARQIDDVKMAEMFGGCGSWS